MSNVNQARRTTAQVVFNGVDISVYVNGDLISLTYTDNDYNIDDIALQVIRGDWDNGEARYDKLTTAGYDYYAVQNRVNEILGIK